MSNPNPAITPYSLIVDVWKNPRYKMIRQVLRVVLLAYSFACLGVTINQRELIYHPTDSAPQSADQLMKLGDETIRVTVINPSQPSVNPHEASPSNPLIGAAILYFGGNNEAVAEQTDMFTKLFPRSTVYLMHYRGYDGSSGSPNEEGLVADALALYDSVAAKYRSVFVIGRSLGSGIAVQLAAKRKIAKLVLVTPYDSLISVASDHYPWVPVGLLLFDRFNSMHHVRAISAPVVFINVKADKVIPEWSTQRLVHAFPSSQVTVHALTDITHGDVYMHPDYYSLLRQGLVR